MKWSPLKAAVVTFLLVLLVGIVVGAAASSQIHGDAYERGRRFGQGLATFAVVASLAAYAIQRKRAG
ncbi:MAG: hypothetical protein ABI678_24440 [Kofleriaceae bacterium]